MNFPVKPIIDTVSKILTKVGTIATAASKKSVNVVGRAARKKKSDSNSLEPSQMIQIAQGGFGVGWAVVVFLLTMVFLLCIPAVKKFAETALGRMKTTLGVLISNSKMGRNPGPVMYATSFVVRMVFYTLWVLIDKILIPLVKNAYFIFGYVVVACLFIYLGERHLHDGILVLDAIANLGVRSLNLAGLMLQFIVEAKNGFAPYTNQMIRFQFFTMLELWDVIKETMSGSSPFRSGRRLDSIVGSEGYKSLLSEIFLVFGTILNVVLTLVTAVIRVFGQLGLVVFSAIAKYIVAFAIKLMCALSGTYCFFLEFFDFIIYDFFAMLLGGLIPPNHDIACTAQTLNSMHIGSTCAGGFASIDPPGLYRNADVSKRRSTLACVYDGNWTESLNGVVITSIAEPNQACPMVRSSVTPLGHAMNLRTMRSHECYNICVGDVEYTQCENEVRRLVGPCGAKTEVWSKTLARRRLNSIFTKPTAATPIWLGADPSSRRQLGLTSFDFVPEMARETPFNAQNSREQNIEALRTSMGQMEFDSTFGACNLTTNSDSIFAILYDGACVVNKVWSKGRPPGRSLQSVEYTTTNLDWLDDLRHETRIANLRLNQAPHDRHHPEIRSGVGGALGDLAFMLGRVSTPCPDGLVRCHPSIKCVEACPIPTRRRLVETVERPCQDAELLCANGIECVDNLDDCYEAASHSTLGYLRSVLGEATNTLRSIDPGQSLSDVLQCWYDLRDNPETDAYYGLNMMAPLDDLLTRCVWCTPMWKPSIWTFTPFVYSLQSEVYSACADVSIDFADCVCPMFYDLPSTTYRVGTDLSLDLGYILANGLIWLKNPIAYALGDVPGKFWSSLFPAYMFPADVSHALSLYRANRTAYAVCYVTHFGSLMVLLGFVYAATLATGAVAAWMAVVVAGARLPSEAVEEDLERRVQETHNRLDVLESQTWIPSAEFKPAA